MIGAVERAQQAILSEEAEDAIVERLRQVPALREVQTASLRAIARGAQSALYREVVKQT